MNRSEILKQYAKRCNKALEINSHARAILKNRGIYEDYILENFMIGYSDGRILETVSKDDGLLNLFENAGIVKNGKEVFKSCITIPIFGEDKEVINIVGYNIYPRSKNKMVMLNDSGIFNRHFLSKAKEIILTENPLETLLLIQNDFPAITFLFGDDSKYVSFINQSGIKRVIFIFEGKMRLFYELSKNGVSAKRVTVNFDKAKKAGSKEYLETVFSEKPSNEEDEKETSDIIQEIENGFLFKFPHLNYKVIGNFTEYTMNMKANVKVYTKEDVFVDQVDLYKNRDRQNLIYNIIDKFNIRDQIQLENDLTQIIEVIEKHKENKEKEKKRVKPQLTEYQKNIGSQFLKNPNLIDEIEQDYEKLGYVRERKNKILLYLIMTSRLMDNPLHAILISRSGAGKSMLSEVTESLCPPEELESISDLSAQALYYYGKDDLKHRFIVIGEKEGSQNSDYPLRELITKKSITKAIPMKDQVTG